MRVSLCLLVCDELEGCKIDVPNLPLSGFEEFYAIDAGSTDGTVEYLQSQGIPVYRQSKRGLNAAYLEAVERSSCDAVVTFFPKGALPVLDTLKFRKYFEEGFHLVVASRNLPGAFNEEDIKLLKPRKWAVMALAGVAALLWRREGYVIRDILHGFKGFTVEGFKQMAPSDFGLSIDLELTVRSYRLRLRRAEFPTSERPRPFGATHFKAWPTGVKLAKYMWRELRR